jgi:competence protein ComEA
MIFEKLPRRQTAILLVVCVVVLALVGKRIAAAGTARAPAAQAVSLSEGRSAGGRASNAPKLVVYVVGAVRHAGLVRLPDGARVADALEHAGGPTRRADLTLVNLAAPVADGQQIVVPARVTASAGGDAGDATATAPAKVSLASATLEQLDALPGVGPVTAQKILDWRQTHGPLRSADDLDAIPGIGPARVEQLRGLVTP